MISVIILTKNEENNIVDCLETVSWADEIIVIDDFSTDRTLQVVKNFSPRIKIYQRKLEYDFSAQRNFALSKAKGDWILFIDADERLTNGLKGEIMDYVASDNLEKNAFYIKRRDILWERSIKHGEAGNIRLIRFGKKDSGKWVGKVHETWEINEKIGEFNMYLYHYPHQSISEFLKEINHYTDLRAKELYSKGVKTSVYQIILYPKAKFILNYIFKLGFLDGIEGFILAIIMSFHSFLVRAKLWILLKKTQKNIII